MKISTPISYYGGKQKLAPIITRLIPPHILYCEPFLGGAAVFFAKEQSPIEVLNDTNRELMNFYIQVQTNFPLLEQEVRITLHSRDLHRKASVIYNNPDMFSDLKRAWAVWLLSSQSFCAQLGGSFGYDKKRNNTTKKIMNKRDSFTEDIAIRLQNVQLECADALYVIKSRDTKDSFFYCDPPYFNSNCGHYDGYSEQDFKNLLELLTCIEGKFLLSSYNSDLLREFTASQGWHRLVFEQGVSVNTKAVYQKKKCEVLTSNYPLQV